MSKILVLGANGMLGSMVASVLDQYPEFEVTTTVRGNGSAETDGRSELRYEVATDSIEGILDVADCEWIINAIGVIKPRIDERVPTSIEHAIAVNSLFPHRLAAAAAERGQRVIQIATDCVFSGASGAYHETAPHDPIDVYGKTKSLGEVPSDSVIHLRCSIVGPEMERSSSLLAWILSTSPGGELRGFIDHFWNGVTTLQFARLCAAVISGAEVASPLHVVPGDSVNKAELLRLVLDAYDRDDVSVTPGPAPQAIDRTLATTHPEVNAALWRAAGYEHPPTIREMLIELAGYRTVASASSL